jgi:pSer/pThr/pTyr-binding forkhead associated (FHA) protein
MLGWVTFHDGPLRSQVIPLEASNVIGADPGCKIVLGQTVVSSRHAEIFRTEHGFVVRDLGSTNGTFVNNVRITESALVDGDVIRLGTSEMVFKRHFVADIGGSR